MMLCGMINVQRKEGRKKGRTKKEAITNQYTNITTPRPNNHKDMCGLIGKMFE